MTSPHYFKISLGMNAAGIQNELMTALKNMKADVIQTSDGLVVRNSSSTEELEQVLQSVDSSLKAEPLDLKSLSENPHTAKDILAFTGLR